MKLKTRPSSEITKTNMKYHAEMCFDFHHPPGISDSLAKTYVLMSDGTLAKPSYSTVDPEKRMGIECYPYDVLDNATALIHVKITKGKHECKLEIKRKPDKPKAVKELIKTILKIHKCPDTVSELIRVFPEHRDFILKTAGL